MLLVGVRSRHSILNHRISGHRGNWPSKREIAEKAARRLARKLPAVCVAPSHGRPHRESSGSAVRADVERLLRRRLGEVAEGRRLVGRERERTTFDDLERLIVDDYRLHGRKSLDSVLQSFRALRRVFGGRRACDIGYEDLTRYAAEPGAASATVRRELPLLHRSAGCPSFIRLLFVTDAILKPVGWRGAGHDD